MPMDSRNPLTMIASVVAITLVSRPDAVRATSRPPAAEHWQLTDRVHHESVEQLVGRRKPRPRAREAQANNAGDQYVGPSSDTQDDHRQGFRRRRSEDEPKRRLRDLGAQNDVADETRQRQCPAQERNEPDRGDFVDPDAEVCLRVVRMLV